MTVGELEIMNDDPAAAAGAEPAHHPALPVPSPRQRLCASIPTPIITAAARNCWYGPDPLRCDVGSSREECRRRYGKAANDLGMEYCACKPPAERSACCA